MDSTQRASASAHPKSSNVRTKSDTQYSEAADLSKQLHVTKENLKSDTVTRIGPFTSSSTKSMFAVSTSSCPTSSTTIGVSSSSTSFSSSSRPSSEFNGTKSQKKSTGKWHVSIEIIEPSALLCSTSLYSTRLFSALLYSILLRPILFYSILFHSPLLCPIPLSSILLFSSLFFSTLFYSFHSWGHSLPLTLNFHFMMISRWLKGFLLSLASVAISLFHPLFFIYHLYYFFNFTNILHDRPFYIKIFNFHNLIRSYLCISLFPLNRPLSSIHQSPTQPNPHVQLTTPLRTKWFFELWLYSPKGLWFLSVTVYTTLSPPTCHKASIIYLIVEFSVWDPYNFIDCLLL